MGGRFLITLAVLAILALPMALFLHRPAAGLLRGGIELPMLPDLPKPSIPRAVAKLRLDDPLGLLILDWSGSMKSNDRDFRQSQASEIFAYFFARLVVEDVDPAALGRVHFAAILYPSARAAGGSGAVLETRGIDASIMAWEAEDAAEGRAWMALGGGDPDYRAAVERNLQRVEDQFRLFMGGPGLGDQRNGSSTPYPAAITTAKALIDRYRQEHPGSHIYAVFMTDAGSGGQPRQIQRHAPGIFLEEVELQGPAGADEMIPSFLRALQLEPLDITGEIAGQGFDFTPFADRPIPILVNGPKPRIVTDAGAEVALRGRDGIHYAVFDPRLPEHATARELRLEGGRPGKVRIFHRPSWELTVDPHYYDLIGGDDRPALSLRHTGSPGGIQAARTARVEDEVGSVVAIVELVHDPEEGAYLGLMPEPSAFPPPGSRYRVVAEVEGGEEPLVFPFVVTRDVRIRFLDNRNEQTSRRIDFLPLHPKLR